LITSPFRFSALTSAATLLAVGFATLLGIIATTIWLGDRVQRHFSSVIAARDTRAAAVELRSALQTAESSQRGFLVSGNEIYLAPYDRAKSLVRTQLHDLKRGLLDYPEFEELVKRLERVVSEKIEDMDQSIDLKSRFQDEVAMSEFQSNRGKALMDEANVYLSGVIRSADSRLTISTSEQRSNANLLRWVSVVGAFVIILVVSGAVGVMGYVMREIAKARDQVHQMNTSLEVRVADRTADLARARDRAEALLAEVNHRVANSLALVLSFVRLQSRALPDEAAKNALSEMEARVNAVASVHRSLYTSGNVESVELKDYLTAILDNLASVMRADGIETNLVYQIEPTNLRTDASINLGVIATEWVTNACKYAYPDRGGPIRVHLRSLPDDQGELVVEDDGVGISASKPRGTGIGSRIVIAMAESIRGKIQYADRSPGTAARIVFPLEG
jgi:two-component sensor histidine kinase